MVQQFLSIQETLREYNREAKRDSIEVAEQGRQELLNHFPLNSWPTLTLERYALGQDDSSDTYCYWLEFGSMHLAGMLTWRCYCTRRGTWCGCWRRGQ